MWSSKQSAMSRGRGGLLRAGGILLVALTSFFGLGQEKAQAGDAALLQAYQRAAHIQAYEYHRTFRNLQVRPHWLSGSSFWYARDGDVGTEWVVVEADLARKIPAFDHRKLAARLSRAMGRPVRAVDLPLQQVENDERPRKVRFSAFGKDWEYVADTNRLRELDASIPSGLGSPDGKWMLFTREHDLWLRSRRSNEERRLTHDGLAYYGYGAMPDATGRRSVRPEAIWSADSRRLLVVQTDDRQVKDLPMIDFAPDDGSVRPTAWARRTALPGDDHVTTFRMLAIDVDSGKQVAADYRPLSAVRMNDTPMGGGRAWWGRDGRRAYFVDIERGEQKARVVEFDTITGATRTLFEERAQAYLELGSNVYMPVSLVALAESNELIWYSERSGSAHLYLYDLGSGQLKRVLTAGDWRVRDVLGVDPVARQVYFTLAEDESGKDPYYRSVARVALEGGKVVKLSGSDADHAVLTRGDPGMLALSLRGQDTTMVGALAPGAGYFVETVGTVAQLPSSDLRRADGSLVMTLEQATASGLPPTWQWPERVRLTAADGRTDIRGVVFRPSGFSSLRRYPVIDFIYGGPQVSYAPDAVGGGDFGLAQAIAELGFVVVMLDGRGTAERSRAFHEASYAAVQTASDLQDHIAGIRQLAQRYPYLDLDRVGVYGFSGGGYMTAQAMLRFPEFFKVGVAGAGNYDQRLFWHGWGERYQGLADGDNYRSQASTTYAGGLQGKLLFIHGLMDFGVHPAGLFQLTQALMDANKTFDLVLMPRAAHELPGYAMVRMWDYFVRHLAGQSPPPQFSAMTSSEWRRAKSQQEQAASQSGKDNEARRQP